MKRVFLTLCLVVFLISITVATNVTLSSDKSTLTLGEEIKFHLEIKPSKPVGGKLSVYREVRHNEFRLTRILFSKPTPSQCATCVGDTPLSEDLERNFYFKPQLKGTYYAEANFGGVRDKVEFNVVEATTTTTTTTTPTTLPITTTTPTTLATATTSTTLTTATTSTTLAITTTTLATTTTLEEKSSCTSCTYSWFLVLIFVIIIFLIVSKLIPLARK